MRSNNKIRLLKSVNLFSQLNDDAIEVIADFSDFKTYQHEETIFTEGTFGESLYIVREGEARIIKRTDDEKEHDIAKFIKGEVFGELDLFEESPRTATAKAEETVDPLSREKTPTTLLIFPKNGIKFRDLLEKYPEIFGKILNVLITQIASRIRSTNRLVSEKTQWIEDLRKQVLYDKLTGLYNRTFLTEDFVVHLPSYGKTTSVLAAKPDKFKYVNDTYGHDIGDKVLRLMADSIKSCMRDTDYAIRYKSDEFIIVLPNTGNDTAHDIAVKLKDLLGDLSISHLANGDPFKTTWSVGLATYPIHEDDAAGIVTLSFNKMLDQRNAGGNGVASA